MSPVRYVSTANIWHQSVESAAFSPELYVRPLLHLPTNFH